VVREPLGLRAAGAAELGAVVTGLGGDQKGRLTLVPPAPRAVVHDAAGEVLGTREPAYAVLSSHGPAARRRRWVRALGPALALLAAVLLLVLLAALPAAWLLPAALPVLPAAALARDRSRALGHALADGHVVARSGSLARRREVLGVGHVIGWTVRDTWFQRRQGLVTLDATTAGGRQRVTVLDVPEAAGLALAGAATPDLLAPFVVETGPTG
jgi:putative membrane protein